MMNISTLFLVCLCVTSEMVGTFGHKSKGSHKVKRQLLEITDPAEQFWLHCRSPDSPRTKELCRVFEMLDQDGSNSLNLYEFWNGILRTVFYIEKQEEADAVFKKVDLDGNGVLDFGEFLKIIRALM